MNSAFLPLAGAVEQAKASAAKLQDVLSGFHPLAKIPSLVLPLAKGRLRGIGLLA
jgi:hypothetical protein